MLDDRRARDLPRRLRVLPRPSDDAEPTEAANSGFCAAAAPAPSSHARIAALPAPGGATTEPATPYTDDGPRCSTSFSSISRS